MAWRQCGHLLKIRVFRGLLEKQQLLQKEWPQGTRVLGLTRMSKQMAQLISSEILEEKSSSSCFFIFVVVILIPCLIVYDSISLCFDGVNVFEDDDNASSTGCLRCLKIQEQKACESLGAGKAGEFLLTPAVTKLNTRFSTGFYWFTNREKKRLEVCHRRTILVLQFSKAFSCFLMGVSRLSKPSNLRARDNDMTDCTA